MISEADRKIIDSLEKPGAGIPKLHQFFLKTIIAPFVAGRSGWDADSKFFNDINAKIFTMLEGYNDDQLNKRVLVPRLRGLEDSSRYWSLSMVVEHLLIVGRGISTTIVLLSKGIVPKGEVSTAHVKPGGEADPEAIIAAYKKFVQTATADIDRDVLDKNSQTRYAHPWFGAMTAHQWHWLFARHAGIHLEQIQHVIKGMRVTDSE